MTNLSLPVLMVKSSTKPIRSRPGRRAIAKVEPNIFLPDADELVASLLPRIDGHGLSGAEFARIIGAERRAVAAYRIDVPNAGAKELDRLGQIAATDALRAVLRDRPVGTSNRDVITVTGDIVSNDVIPGSDPEMTPEELELLVELNRENPAGAVEAELEKFPAFTGWPEFTRNFYWTPDVEPRLTLVELIELEAKHLRDRGNEAGELMAGALTELARVVRIVSADRPDQVEERLSVLERDFTEPVEFEPELTAGGRWA